MKNGCQVIEDFLNGPNFDPFWPPATSRVNGWGSSSGPKQKTVRRFQHRFNFVRIPSGSQDGGGRYDRTLRLRWVRKEFRRCRLDFLITLSAVITDLLSLLPGAMLLLGARPAAVAARVDVLRRHAAAEEHVEQFLGSDVGCGRGTGEKRHGPRHPVEADRRTQQIPQRSW